MQPPRFSRHAFVCVNAESCALDGAEAVHQAMKERLRAAGRKEDLRVNKAGCLGQCGHGPLVVVYPDNVWYSHVTVADAQRIWDEHMVAGQPVADLHYDTSGEGEPGGTNVLGRGADGVCRPIGGARSSRCKRCPV